MRLEISNNIYNNNSLYDNKILKASKKTKQLNNEKTYHRL